MTIKEVSEKFGLTQDTLRYYERAGMIPPVSRNARGVRDYTEEDLKWVGLAKCMRSAGLSVETLAEYVRLFREGEETIPARLALLQQQRNALMDQQKRIAETISRLDFKISRYENAMETGTLDWNSKGE
ncbi:MAG: MerR family transcriptional regulator [Clostridia bacterium]|nr:MerR family transcriptional regulator [Clostridia bacterium]